MKLVDPPKPKLQPFAVVLSDEENGTLTIDFVTAIDVKTAICCFLKLKATDFADMAKLDEYLSKKDIFVGARAIPHIMLP